MAPHQQDQRTVTLIIHCSQAWNLTGDAFTLHPGDKPWISEMYGYSFGCSSQNVWHRTSETGMLYPGYMPQGIDGVPQLSGLLL